MKIRSLRSLFAAGALVAALLLSPFAAPAQAETCKLSNGEQVQCICDNIQQIASMFFKASCIVEGRGAMTCIAFSTVGPWRCDETLGVVYTYTTPMNDCTLTPSGAGIGSGGGSARAGSFAYQHSFSGGSCSSTFSRPSGSLASLIQFYRWNGGGWSLCRDSGWSYSNVNTWGWELTWGFGSTTPCGAGYYHTAGFGYQHNGFDWRGGYLQSDYLYLSGFSPLRAESNSDTVVSEPPPRAITADELRPPKSPGRPPTKGSRPETLAPGLTAKAAS